jgi:F0F1-type ATP synthase membrane subunit b/b'
MTSNDKLRPYLFAFLAFCVLSSKHIIIYNEELLVAVSFLAFVLFSLHYFGNTIQESLDERRDGIKAELERFFFLKRESLEELSQQHDKVSLLKRGLDSLRECTKGEAVEGAARGAASLKEIFAQQVGQRLQSMLLATSPLLTKWQDHVAQSQLGSVLFTLEKGKEKSTSWNPRVAERALEMLNQKKTLR